MRFFYAVRLRPRALVANDQTGPEVRFHQRNINNFKISTCHSERSEESINSRTNITSTPWILRCAQDDNRLTVRSHREKIFAGEVRLHAHLKSPSLYTCLIASKSSNASAPLSRNSSLGWIARSQQLVRLFQRLNRHPLQSKDLRLPPFRVQFKCPAIKPRSTPLLRKSSRSIKKKGQHWKEA